MEALISGVAAAPNEDGRLQLFGVAANGQVESSYQTAPNGSWSNRYSLGGLLGS
jgi:hypothetical protein